MDQYVPERPPVNLAELPEFLMNEFQKVGRVLKGLHHGQVLYERHVPPEKPRYGLYLADGSNWNPSDGRGLYWYDETTGLFVPTGGGGGGGGLTSEDVQDIVGTMTTDT